MSDNPLVVCVMLTNGSRPDMLERAIRCFHAQTYLNKALLVFHSGPDPFISPTYGVQVVWSPGVPRSIGELRNIANAVAEKDAAIIAHFDDDDWSAPQRLEEQVKHLQSSGAQVVGYREMLFCDSIPGQFCGAWLYRNPHPHYCIGTSLMYWASVWKDDPFPNRKTAEDTIWCLKRKCAAVSAGVMQPRMIASIHGGNTCSKIDPGKVEWTRVPKSDELCRRLMAYEANDAA